MSQRIPNHLKLHQQLPAECAAPGPDEIPGLDALCRGFERTTGWRLHVEPAAGAGHSHTPAAWSGTILDGSRKPIWRLIVEHPLAPTAGGSVAVDTAMPLEQILSLAESLREMLSELILAHHVIWQREAELAAGVPVSTHPDEERHLAERLQAVLRAGVESVGCQAAALYLLDEATSQLKLRSCWGLPRTRLLQPARPLRGALADLEALLGHAVVIEDAASLPHWKTPEDYPAAVCVPVSTPSMPLGTLWLFADESRQFTEQETQMIEVVAGRVAADLERTMLLWQGVESKQRDEEIKAAADWQRSRMPTVKPLLENWQVAGHSHAGESVGGMFHDWFVLPSGLLAAAVGKSEGDSLVAAMNAAAVHGAMKAHASHEANTQRLLNRLNETIWTSGSGDQFASLFFGLIHPEQSWLEWAAAGDVRAVLVRQSNYRPLLPHPSLLGSDPDVLYRRRRFRVRSHDTLVIYSSSSKLTNVEAVRTDARLARAVRRIRRSSADQLARHLNRALAQVQDQPAERALLVVRRR